MPLYEYACDACGHRFETIQKFSDSPLEECPKCGAALRKLQSAPAFQFKGSGWYVTDYGNKDASGGTKPDKADKADKSEGGTKETKPGGSPDAAAKTDASKPAGDSNSSTGSSSPSTTATTAPSSKG